MLGGAIRGSGSPTPLPLRRGTKRWWGAHQREVSGCRWGGVQILPRRYLLSLLARAAAGTPAGAPPPPGATAAAVATPVVWRIGGVCREGVVWRDTLPHSTPSLQGGRCVEGREVCGGVWILTPTSSRLASLRGAWGVSCASDWKQCPKTAPAGKALCSDGCIATVAPFPCMSAMSLSFTRHAMGRPSMPPWT